MIIDPHLLDLFFVCFGLLALLTVPLAAAVVLPVVVLLWFNSTPLPPDFFINYSLAMRLNSPALLSIPLFAVAGELAVASGVAERLLGVADLFGGHGSRAVGTRTILGCTLFATVSGVGPTVINAESKRLVPKMVRAGFTREAAAGALSCAAVLSIVIPASVPMTIYAATIGLPMNVIATSCFLPGLLLSALMLLVMHWYSRRRLVSQRLWRDPTRRWLVVLWGAKWALLLPLIILPALFTGFFSAPEAAAFSCVYCLAVGRFAHGGMDAAEVWNSMARSATGTAAVLLLAGVGSLFAMLMEGCGFSDRLADTVFRFCGGRAGSILAINILLLVAGCFMDMPAIISLLIPLLLPLVRMCGMQLPHFGVVVVMNVAIGLVTPPQAWNIAAAAEASGLDMWRTARAAAPFIAVMVGGLLLVSYWPGLSLWFPGLFGWPV